MTRGALGVGNSLLRNGDRGELGLIFTDLYSGLLTVFTSDRLCGRRAEAGIKNARTNIGAIHHDDTALSSKRWNIMGIWDYWLRFFFHILDS